MGLALALLALATRGRLAVGWPRSAAAAAAALFLGLNGLAALVSVEPRTALLGTYGHDQGLLTLVIEVGYFFLAAAWVRDEGSLARFSVALVATAALIGVYAIAQYHGIDPLGWVPPIGSARRTFGTVGNPNQLGELLALSLPLTGWLFGRARGYRRDLVLAAAGLQLVALVLSQARVAWFTVLLEAMVGGVVLASARRDAGWARRVGTVVALLMPAIAVGALVLLLAVPASATIAEAVVGRVLARGETLQARQYIWRSAVAMIADRPWLGWGPDTFQLVYPAYRSPDLDALERVVGRDDAAHDVLLGVAVSAGLLGLAAYLALQLAVLRLLLLNLVRRAASGPGFRASAALPLLLIWTGYLLLFVFGQPRVLTDWLAWTVGGVAVGLFARRPERRLRLPRPAGLLSAALAGGLLLETASGLAADLAAGRARDSRQADLPAESVALLRRAVELRPFEPAYRQALGLSLAELGRRTGDATTLRASLDELSRASALSGQRDASVLALMADAVLDWEAATGATTATGQAYARRAIALDPLNPLLHASAAEVALRSGRPALARAHWEAARSRARSPDALARLGDVARLLGEVDGARAAYRDAAFRGGGLPNQAALFIAWGRAAVLAGQPDEAAEAFGRALDLVPNDAAVRLERAETLAAAGRDDEALAEVRRVLEREPANRRAADLARRLGRPIS